MSVIQMEREKVEYQSNVHIDIKHKFITLKYYEPRHPVVQFNLLDFFLQPKRQPQQRRPSAPQPPLPDEEYEEVGQIL